MKAIIVCLPLAALFLLGCPEQQPQEEGPSWIPLFNGRDLSGWHIKINGQDLDQDSLATFAVHDSLLQVSYDGYTDFGQQYGHIFYKDPFENYRLRVEYRFVGDQASGGQGWAFRNSGIMFHCQSPESMRRHQDFPISLEAQFLGGDGTDERPTMNLCTPGTHVTIEGGLVTDHCINSSSPTFHGDQWVTAEIEVYSDSLIRHYVNGEVVLTYSNPILGGGVVSGFDPAEKVDGQALKNGYISLQSESHPIHFRKVEVLKLD